MPSEKLAAVGCDPILAMARLAIDEKERALRFATLEELRNTSRRKGKAIEVSSAHGPIATQSGPTLLLVL